MKILHVINNLAVGGAQKLILDTLPLYESHGLEIDLVLLSNQANAFLNELKQKFKGKIFEIGNDSVYNPILIIKLAKLMKNYDLVHVHLFPAQYFALAANKINRNKSKILFTEHCTSNKRMEYKVFKPIEQFVYNKYDKTICITPEIQTILKKHANASENKLPIIHNGVDLHKINGAKSYKKSEIHPSIRESDKIVIQVAAFRLQKDHPTAIRAMQLLPENYKLVLVGDGKEKVNCQKLVKEISLEDKVVFLDRRNDVPQLLKTADYVVLASHFEGLSLSSIEGMASGKPFIASDVPGLTEIVKGYGVMFEDGNEKELANKILELNNNQELYDQVVKKCQIRAKEFDIEHMINQHISLYQSMDV